MALINLKCASCNGEIQLDNAKEFGFCMHCGTKVMYQEAVQRIKVEIDGIDTFEKLSKNAEIFTKLKDYPKAEQVFQSLTNHYPGSYLGWWGLFDVEIQKEYSSINMENSFVLLSKAYKVAKPQELEIMKDSVQNFCSKYLHELVEKKQNFLLDYEKCSIDLNDKLEEACLYYGRSGIIGMLAYLAFNVGCILFACFGFFVIVVSFFREDLRSDVGMGFQYLIFSLLILGFVKVSRNYKLHTARKNFFNRNNKTLKSFGSWDANQIRLDLFSKIDELEENKNLYINKFNLNFKICNDMLRMFTGG